MAKFPLKWHKEVHKLSENWVQVNKRDLEVYIATKSAEIEGAERKNARHAAQIARAEAEGIEEFDRDNFLPVTKSMVRRLKAQKVLDQV